MRMGWILSSVILFGLVCMSCGGGGGDAPLSVDVGGAEGSVDGVEEAPTGWSVENLLGRVRRAETLCYGRVDDTDEMRLTLSYVDEFSETGQHLSRDQLMAPVGMEESRSRFDYEYGAHGRCISSTYQVNGEMIRRSVYTYNEKGDMLRAYMYDADNMLTDSTVYRYEYVRNDSWRPTWRKRVMWTDQVRNEYTYFEDSGLEHTMSQYLGDSPEVQMYMRYSYDAEGNMTGSWMYGLGMQLDLFNVREYDGSNRVVRDAQHDGDSMLMYCNRYTYDAYGNQKSLAREGVEGADEGYWEMEYEYDAQGNWIRMREFDCGSDDAGSRVMLSEHVRKITYF